MFDPAINPRVFGNWRHCLAFGFGSGLARFAPGTFGTLVAIPPYVCMAHLPAWMYAVIVFVAFAFGISVCETVSRDLGARDHGGIVFDDRLLDYDVLAARYLELVAGRIRRLPAVRHLEAWADPLVRPARRRGASASCWTTSSQARARASCYTVCGSRWVRHSGIRWLGIDEPPRCTRSMVGRSGQVHVFMNRYADSLLQERVQGAVRECCDQRRQIGRRAGSAGVRYRPLDEAASRQPPNRPKGKTSAVTEDVPTAYACESLKSEAWFSRRQSRRRNRGGKPWFANRTSSNV
jgi:hypothetical protein